MEHKQVRDNHIVERYILGEMSEAERDSFEEHFFECRECAREVHMTDVFRANVRAYHENRARLAAPPVRRNFFREAFAVAAVALLAVVSLSSYQNLVTIPRLSKIAEIAENPQPLQPLALREATRGDKPILNLGPNEERPANLSIHIVLPSQYQRYRVEFAPECGQIKPVEWVNPEPGLPLELAMPTSQLAAGTCDLTVYGVASGVPEKLKTLSFIINRSKE